MIDTFEEKLAYEIGVKLAQQDYLEKEASMAAFKALGSGLKGVATGQGTTMSQAFQAGAKATKGGYAGPMNFRGVMGEIGQGLKAPWQNMYKTYGARQGVKAVNAANAEYAAAQKAYQTALKGTDTAAQQAAKATMDAAAKNIGKVGNRYGVGYGATNNPAFQRLQATAQRGYIPRDAATGAVNYGQLGTMAAGAGLVGTGGYMAGNAAFGGGDTYNRYTTNVTKVTKAAPQQAPHEYYLNRFFGKG